MDERTQLEQAIAQAHSILGTYSSLANIVQNPQEKQMYKNMVQDSQHHIDMLNTRLSYVIHSSNINQG